MLAPIGSARQCCQVAGAHDGQGLEARGNKEVCEHEPDLGLARPIVVSTHKDTALPRELQGSRRGPWVPTKASAALQGAGHRGQRGGQHFQAQLDGMQQARSGVTETQEHSAEALRVCRTSPAAACARVPGRTSSACALWLVSCEELGGYRQSLELRVSESGRRSPYRACERCHTSCRCRDDHARVGGQAVFEHHWGQ